MPGKEDDDERTKVIIARTTYGEMFDFLKAYPSVTMEEYMWKMNVAQIALAKYDTTHIEYLSEEQIKRNKAIKIDSPINLINDLGFKIPIIKEE